MTILLDGGMGRELRMRGGKILNTLWSMRVAGGRREVVASQATWRGSGRERQA